MMNESDDDELLTMQEAVNRFRVRPRTLQRWVMEGKVSTVRTVRGGRRYRRSDIEVLLRRGRSDDPAV
jgi:excisionase family DNA binding protein